MSFSSSLNVVSGLSMSLSEPSKSNFWGLPAGFFLTGSVCGVSDSDSDSDSVSAFAWTTYIFNPQPDVPNVHTEMFTVATHMYVWTKYYSHDMYQL